MLLTYVDESYTKERYYIAAVAVTHENIRSLQRALREVVDEAARKYGVRDHAELHGHPLFHGKEDWEGLEPRQRIGVYSAAFDALATHEVRIILRGVNTKRLRERYVRPNPPHDVCLQHTLERIDALAKRTDECALVIADELHEHDRHRKALTDFRNFGTPGYRSTTLPQIVDTIHFAPSHHSPMLQAADLVAFLHRRRQTHTETHPKAEAANEKLWARIRGCIHHNGTWRP